MLGERRRCIAQPHEAERAVVGAYHVPVGQEHRKRFVIVVAHPAYPIDHEAQVSAFQYATVGLDIDRVLAIAAFPVRRTDRQWGPALGPARRQTGRAASESQREQQRGSKRGAVHGQRIARPGLGCDRQSRVALTKYSYSSRLLVRFLNVVTVAPRNPHSSKISAKMRSTGKTTSKNFELPTT